MQAPMWFRWVRPSSFGSGGIKPDLAVASGTVPWHRDWNVLVEYVARDAVAQSASNMYSLPELRRVTPLS